MLEAGLYLRRRRGRGLPLEVYSSPARYLGAWFASKVAYNLGTYAYAVYLPTYVGTWFTTLTYIVLQPTRRFKPEQYAF